MLVLCIYNGSVGWALSKYYGSRQQGSLLLAQCCLGRSCLTNLVPLIDDHMLPKVFHGYTEGIGLLIVAQDKAEVGKLDI